MSVHKIVIDTAKAGASFVSAIRAASSSREMITALSEYFAAVAGGVEAAKIRIHTTGVQAVNAVTLASFVEDDTITVNGVVFTGKDTPSTAVQFTTGVSDNATANSFRAIINASTADKVEGEVYATRRATVACASVIATDTLIINGITFTISASPTAGNYKQVAVGASNALMGDYLVAAITEAKKYERALFGLVSVTNSSGTLTLNFDGDCTITSTGGTMTVVDLIIVLTMNYGGAAGNLGTLAISAHGTVTGANFASGVDGAHYTYLTV